jgi:hypothetical protein
MNKTKSIVIGSLIVAVGLTACDQNGSLHRNPGKTYAPDMTYSRAYDAYSSNPNFADSQSSRRPVTGTIAVGHELPDHLKEGDSNAYKTFSTHLRFSEEELKEGGRLYNIYCGVCHGQKLDGNGPLYNGGAGKFVAAPANFSGPNYINMPVGQMYAAIKFGKGMMGSYASQLDIKQRWMIIAHIKQWQSSNGGGAFTLGAAGTAKGGTKAAADSAAVSTTTPAKTTKG